VPYLVDIEKLIKIQVEQIIVPGYEPEFDYEYPPSGNKSHRRPPAPPVAPAPAVAPRRERLSGTGRNSSGSFNKSADRSVDRNFDKNAGKTAGKSGRRQNHLAADGFDFTKPYESAEPHPVTAPADTETAKIIAHMEHPHKPRRMVAALLGGLGRK